MIILKIDGGQPVDIYQADCADWLCSMLLRLDATFAAQKLAKMNAIPLDGFNYLEDDELREAKECDCGEFYDGWYLYAANEENDKS